MLYGKVLRPPSYRATLESIDLSAADAMDDVVVARDGEFIGFAAPSTFRAKAALDAVAKTASWKTISHPSSNELFSHLKEHARAGRPGTRGSVGPALAGASKVLGETYEVAYVQHAPMEPRAATAEWEEGKLTVWAGVDYRREILTRHDGRGLRGLLEAHPQDVFELEAAAPGILEDVDLPEDYRRAIARLSGGHAPRGD
ncbi:MAG: molybdopterin-dependent oxidoreductase [Candidatus Nealsonbacteria bacterium]|nr:molybdopterin-dependent oxidoreductase [Candidatus Nealsonbacteria bacterium]